MPATLPASVFPNMPATSRDGSRQRGQVRQRGSSFEVGIDSHFHALRHYSATELLTAGVDLRTVAYMVAAVLPLCGSTQRSSARRTGAPQKFLPVE
jgi:integrase